MKENGLTSILDVRRNEEVLFFERKTPFSTDVSGANKKVNANLIPYKALALLNSQDRTEGVCRETVALAMAPLGRFGLRINCALFSLDILFELNNVLLVAGRRRWCVGMAIGFIDLHILDVGVVL